MKFKVGDLIEYVDYNGLPIDTGIVLRIKEMLIVGTLLEILWNSGDVGEFRAGNRTRVIR